MEFITKYRYWIFIGITLLVMRLIKEETGFAFGLIPLFIIFILIEKLAKKERDKPIYPHESNTVEKSKDKLIINSPNKILSEIDIQEKRLKEIDNKQSLLTKSYAKELIDKDEYDKKTQLLEDEKTNIQLNIKKFKIDAENKKISTIAMQNIANKVELLEELRKENIIDDNEFTTKKEKILTDEIEKLKEYPKEGKKLTNNEKMETTKFPLVLIGINLQNYIDSKEDLEVLATIFIQYSKRHSIDGNYVKTHNHLINLITSSKIPTKKAEKVFREHNTDEQYLLAFEKSIRDEFLKQ